LRESEDRYRLLFERAPIGICLVTLDGKVVSANKAMQVITGYSEEELKKINLADTYENPEDRKTLLETLKRHGSAINYLVRKKRKDGTPYDALLNISRIHIADKDFLQTTCADITERKRMEDAWKASEKKYSTLVERGNDGIVIIQDGVVKFLNSIMVKIAGFSPAEVIGKPFIDFMSPEYREMVLERYQKRLKGEEPPNRYEIDLITKDGSKIPVEINASVIEYEGKPADMAIIRDITVRKRIEEELKRSEAKFRRIYDMSMTAIYTTSVEGEIIDMNPLGVSMLGYESLDELKKVNVENTYVNLDDRKRFIRLAGKDPVKGFETKLRRKDGKIIDVIINGYALKNGAGRIVGFQGAIVDITDRKRMEEVLQGRVKELDCLYGVTKLIEQFGDDLDRILDGVVSLIPPAWQCPDIICARIICDGQVFESANFKETDWKQSADIKVRGERIGVVEVYYLEKRPESYEGPFREEERNVINAIATRLGRIIERIRANKELSFKDMLLDAQFETSIDGILVVDHEGKITLSNKRFGEMWNIPREILDTRSEEKALQSVIGQLKDPEKFLEKIKYLREHSKEKSRDEIEFKDGKLFAAYSSSLVDPSGRHHGRIWYFRDITHIRRAEEALRESEEKYRVIVENSPNLVAINQGIWKYVNKAMCERLGWTYEELTSPSFNHFEETVPQRFKAQVKENMTRRLRGEYVPPFERTLKRRDGSEIPVIVQGEKIMYKGKPATELIIIDITKRKKMEAERLRVMSEVCRSIGHDIRNPLHAIRMATHILRDAPEEKRQELLDLIDRDIVYTDRILRNLMDFAYLQPPKLSMEDVNLVLQQTLTQIIIPKNVKLNTRYGDIPQIKLDRDQLTRVFTNLILNATQAIPEDGSGILDIYTDKTGNLIEIKIKDTGVGIPKEKLENVFDPFFTTKAKGIGLGLLTAKSIVEAHDGTITVESKEGRGTTVTVQLPIG